MNAITRFSGGWFGHRQSTRAGSKPARAIIELLESKRLLSASFQLVDAVGVAGGNGTILLPATAKAGKGGAAAGLDSGSGSGASTSSGGTTTTALSTGFNIVINAGPGLSTNQPALAAFERAAAQWESRITDPITVNINADLSNLNNANVIGQTQSVTIQSSYSEIRNAMDADADDEGFDDFIATLLPTVTQARYVLPNGSITGVSATGTSAKDKLSSTKAGLKALGFALDSQFGSNDATITFNSGFSFDYDNTNGVSGSQMDFETVAVHELGHALGFISNVDNIFGNQLYSPPTTLDMFRFELSGTGRNPASSADFSTYPRSQRKNVEAVTDGISGWLTAAPENRMSTVGDGRQASHWKDSDLTGGSPIGILDPTLGFGQIWTISDADWRAMDLIGYDIAPGPVNRPPVAADDSASTNEDTAITIQALANDTDLDGDTLTVDPIVSGSSTLGAAVTVNANGSFTYDPRQSETLQALGASDARQDTFTYTVRDSLGGTDTGTVTITVTGADEVGAPATPTVLTVTKGDATDDGSTSQLTLTWADNSSGEAGFRVRRSTSPGFTAGTYVDFTVPSSGAATATHTDTGLSASTTYYYKVYAFSTDFTVSPPTNVASGTTASPAAPVTTNAGLTARYYASTTFSNQKSVVTDTTGINENWGTGRPAKGMPTDNFTVRWTGQLVPSHDETYHLYGKADDNIRVWIDGELVIRRWDQANTSEWMSAPRQFVAGQAYNIQVDFRERTGGASVSLSWWSPSLGKQIIPSNRFQKHASEPSVNIDSSVEGTTIGKDNGNGSTDGLPWTATVTTVQPQRFVAGPAVQTTPAGYVIGGRPATGTGANDDDADEESLIAMVMR